MTRGLAITNTVLQVLLIVSVLAAVWLARRKRLRRHCLVMRVAVGVQIILIAALMAPALDSFVRPWIGWSGFRAEVVVHHTLGVIAVVLFIFINLVTTRVIKLPGRLRPYMWTAFAIWVVVLGMGLHLYWYLWR